MNHISYIDAVKLITDKKNVAWNWDLSHITKALRLCGSPENQLKYIHVTGTNGKGSTCAMIRNILCDAGYKVGMFCSPSLFEYRDDITVDGNSISERDFAKIVEYLHEIGVLSTLTEFESLFVTAVYYFAQIKCDIVVLECGLGGKNDATNVIPTPEIAVFTPISIDHTSILGSTVEEITVEKCGIIKDGCQIVVAPTQNETSLEIIMQNAAQHGCFVHYPSIHSTKIISNNLDGICFEYDDNVIKIPMLGEHQRDNAVTAIQAVNSLHDFKCDRSNIINGLAKTQIPLRQQVVSRNPLVIVDGAHNFESFKSLANTLKNNNIMDITLIIGMLEDKEIEKCLYIIAEFVQKVIFCKPDNKRALSSEKLRELWRKIGTCENMVIEDEAEKAISIAERSQNVVICGSFYLSKKYKRK